MSDLTRYFRRFPRLRILVFGDLILDDFVVGEVSRINPEAPVPVLRVKREYFAPGGAANAAANVAALGAEAVLLGYVGRDEAASRLRRLLRARKITARLVSSRRPTTCKVRAIARGQQLLRVDYEKDGRAPRKVEEELLRRLEREVGRADAVLVSDYGKGVVTPRTMAAVKELAGDRALVVVDPKPENVESYENVTLITPNTKEAGECIKRTIRSERDLRRTGRELADRLNSHVLITRGERGMSFFSREKRSFDLPTVAKEVADVTGAGDTVAATVTVALAAGAGTRDAVTLSNAAAGLVVSKVGTAVVTLSELRRSVL